MTMRIIITCLFLSISTSLSTAFVVRPTSVSQRKSLCFPYKVRGCSGEKRSVVLFLSVERRNFVYCCF
jgi:hypothetical protein